MGKVPSARISQLLFLLLFLVLFIHTEYRGSDRIALAVNSFFRADPLVGLSYFLAEKSYLVLLFPAVLLALSTLVLGRFFCGWICPLGTILDLVTGKIRKTAPLKFLQGRVKYWLLFPLLFAALFNVNLIGLLDPIAILVRALTFSIYPLFGDTVRQGWVGLYRVLGEGRDLLSPGYGFLRDHLLPFRETFYPLAFLSFSLFLFIVFLERYETRLWCRRLCPLGTLLGLLARFSPIRRSPETLCPDCGDCRRNCPTSFDQDLLQQEECLRCMSCRVKCRFGRVSFKFRGYRDVTPYLPERRVFLGGLVAGFFLARLFRFRDRAAQAAVLRPPGVRDEDAFLKKCVRCGECMKVCLRSALYPAFFQAGVEGLYTPVVSPRLGYCEYNCTLCGQVCPTGAIPDLPPEVKKREVIGKAVLDRNHCLPLAKGINCIVCEEHCPIPRKAIRSEEVQLIDASGRPFVLRKPYVVDDLCNGCGICEYVCPLEGKSGIEVFAVKDRTPLSTVDPEGSSPY
ncbi:MAG: 4Fe-4S binding protein [Deltaproteobacteria bacterium]|nr:4Fe-4S binding protein [Deltaproteobacteria bacterium]